MCHWDEKKWKVYWKIWWVDDHDMTHCVSCIALWYCIENCTRHRALQNISMLGARSPASCQSYHQEEVIRDGIDSINTAQIPKSRQCKRQPKAHLERHIIIHHASQIHLLDIALHPVHGNEVVSSPRRVLCLLVSQTHSRILLFSVRERSSYLPNHDPQSQQQRQRSRESGYHDPGAQPKYTSERDLLYRGGIQRASVVLCERGFGVGRV